MPGPNCPSPQELADLALGRVRPEWLEALAQHVEQCPECHETIAAVGNREDTLVAQIRRPPDQDAYAQEPECQQAVARAKSLAAVAVGVSPGESASPPSRPPQPEAEQSEDLGQLGEYELLAKLGEGGMGVVYKARQVRLDKIVALKVLPNHCTADPMAQARFDREMKAVGRVDHPDIVRAMDAREIDGKSVLVMEYAEGVNLADLGCRHGQLPIPDACEMVRQAALGLQSVHEQGLVHRDIKPSNLMLTGSGTIKILDLGLALLQATQTPGEEMTGSGQPMGTAEYMAPEQVSDAHAVDIRADIYSLGCTLYRLLGGEVPFGGPEYKTAFDKMLAHLQKPVALDRSLASRRARRAGGRAGPHVGQVAGRPLCHACRGGPGDRPLRRGLRPAATAGRPGRGRADALTSPHVSSPGTGTEDRLPPLEKVMVRARGPEPARPSAAHPVALQEAGGVGARTLPAGRGRRRVRGPALAVALLLAAGGIVSVFTLVIHIRDKKGHEKTIEVADDSQIMIERKGPVPGTTTTPSVMPTLPTPVMKSADNHATVGARPAGHEKPFVLVRKGAETGAFKTFSGLWDVCQPGDEIVVYGNGPFPLAPITVHDRALVLKAGAGFRPVFHRDESPMLDRQAWIALQGGAVDVEGCDFVTREIPWHAGRGFSAAKQAGRGAAQLPHRRQVLVPARCANDIADDRELRVVVAHGTWHAVCRLPGDLDQQRPLDRRP